MVQSESVTLSVDYLISSTQAGHLPAWVFLWTKIPLALPLGATAGQSTDESNFLIDTP